MAIMAGVSKRGVKTEAIGKPKIGKRLSEAKEIGIAWRASASARHRWRNHRERRKCGNSENQ